MSSFLSLPSRQLLFSRLVLIYQMPKIGSQTIETTLHHCSFPHAIRRFHYLSPTIAATIRRGLSSKKPDHRWKIDARQQLQSIQEISRAIRFRKLFCSFGGKIPKLEVITGIRELIGLVLSSIFENYLYFAPTIESMDVDRCRKALLHPKTFKELRNWFDLELKHFTGIDVFKTLFPHEQGYCTYENRFARVLVYRFEVLKSLPALLQTFLEHPIPGLVDTNLGSTKGYARQYGLVKEQLRLPAEFVSSIYEDKMMLHFYSNEELLKFRAKWAENPKSTRAMRTRAVHGLKA